MITRGIVSKQTMLHVSADVWLIICSHLQHSPHTIFRLMMASKSVRVELNRTKEWWWEMFYAKVLVYQDSLLHSNFKQSLVQLGKMGNRQRLLQNVFARECRFCKARFGHRMSTGFGIRACPVPCLRENVISNIELQSRYGIYFSDFVQAMVAEHRPILVLHRSQLMAKGSRLLRLLTTMDPQQYTNNPINFWGLVCFFLKEDVQRFVELRVQHQEKTLAARYLSARLIRTALHHHNILVRINRHRQGMQRRLMFPVLPSPYWVAGGPKRAHHHHDLTNVLDGRDGFSQARVLEIESIMNNAWAKHL